MRSLCRGALAALAVLAVVSMVAEPLLAQEQRQGQRRGQRGQRRGGFGFGRGGFNATSMLLFSEQMQEELKLDDDQKAEVEKISADQRAGFGALREIEDEQERGKKFQELSAKTDAAVKKLLKKEQQKRLDEIGLQMRFRFQGTAVLREEKVAKDLKLSDEQKKKLTSISEESATTIAEAREALEGEDLFTVLREIRDEENEKSMAVLTGEQKKQWTAMLGKPFEMQFGRGGRGRGGGAGGQRRRPQQGA